jgi:hypothetical protein
MAPSRPHGRRGPAWESPNALSPTDFARVCLPPSYTVAIPALPCAIWTCPLIYYLYTRFTAALVFCDTTLLSLFIQNTNLLPLFPLAHSEPTARRYSTQPLSLAIPYCEYHQPYTQTGRGNTLPTSQTPSAQLCHQDRRTHLPPANNSHDQTLSTNPARTNPSPQTESQNGSIRNSASKARNLPPRATLHPPRQAQHLGLRGAIRQRRVRLRQRVDRHITHIQHQQQRKRLHREDGRRQSRRGLLIERRSQEEQSVVMRESNVRVEWHVMALIIGMSTN